MTKLFRNHEWRFIFHGDRLECMQKKNRKKRIAIECPFTLSATLSATKRSMYCLDADTATFRSSNRQNLIEFNHL